MRCLIVLSLLVTAAAWQPPELPKQHTVAGIAATAALVASLNTMEPAFAVEHPISTVDSSTTLLLSARSGGRAGGRAYRAPSRSAPTYSRTTIIRPMVAPPPVVISPFGYGYSPFGSPFGGFGLGYGLGAMQSGSDAIRDYRQESEIAQSRAELEQAKAKEKELETRIQQLEQQQKLQPATAQ